MMHGLKRAFDLSPFPLVPRGPLGPLMFPSYVPAYVSLSEVEQEQRPSGNKDLLRTYGIVVGAALCDGEGERANTGYALRFSFWI